MQYINGTFNDLRLFLELESVAAETHLGTNHIFLFYIIHKGSVVLQELHCCVSTKQNTNTTQT